MEESRKVIDKYEKLLQSKQIPIKIHALILKRLAVLYFVFQNTHDQPLKLLNSALTLTLDDYQIYLSLGIIYIAQNQYKLALEKLQKAFNLHQYDYHLNQLVIYLLLKCKLHYADSLVNMKDAVI